MVGIAVVVVILDLLVKGIVTRAIGPEADRHAWWLIGDDVGFEYVRNTGAAFGLLRGNAELLGAISILVAIGFAGLIVIELRGGLWAMVAGGLLVGGAIGNLVERLVDGYVTDFIAVGTWPRFNVADSAITVGVVVFIIGLFVQADRGPVTHDARQGDVTTGGEPRRDRPA
jgi:signal peptidase II